ncbi:MAG TPA: TIGR00730 family Rossman fold protein [Acidimicrobiia bacterium]|nr:TIGR00730 family Rossman fold protein [Acidimicrobiia bacterium]
MPRYDIGDPELDERIAALVADTLGTLEPGDADLIGEMIVTALKLHRDRAGRGDLKLINAALKELRYAFMVFAHYRHIPKVTVFGSARTPPEHPNYRLAADFASRMADTEKWMVVTGAGPGIMEAANRGAGGDYSFGVNIRLPFEASANPYVDDARLINFKYFFTRKLMFVKESNAFALFPGGFGTQDETFELLTLTQTGKTTLHPIVLMEAEGSSYWDGWLDFVRGTLIEQGMIAPDDLALFTHTTEIDEAADEITHFYANYHSQRYVGDHLVLRMRSKADDALVQRLNDEYSDLLASGRIEAIEATDPEITDDDHVDLPRLRLHFDRRSLGRLRRLIDTLNDAVTS